jgi:hypothetical protein
MLGTSGGLLGTSDDGSELSQTMLGRSAAFPLLSSFLRNHTPAGYIIE